MTKINIIIFTILAIVFSQDTYPNFSDPSKQLKFERKRIYIEEVEEKIINITGGGEEYNPLSGLNLFLPFYAQQPTYVKSNIKTNYTYKYKFEITQNNKILNELELLYVIGLNDELERINEEHKKKLIIHNENLEKTKNENFKNENFNKKINRISTWGLYGGLGSGIYWFLHNSENVKKSAIGSAYIISGTLLVYYLYNLLSPKKEIIDINTMQYPVLIQTLSNHQLTAIADSYNRKIFKEISEK